MMRSRILLASLPLSLAACALVALPASAAPRDPSPSVHVINGDSNHTFQAAASNRAGGLSIDAADLGGDGTPELIVGLGIGNEPRVRLLRADGSEIASFLAYAPSVGIGVNVAGCDLDGDGKAEVAVAPQRGGGPHVRVFSAMGEAIDAGGTFAYAPGFRGGVNLACGDMDGDGAEELVTLPASGGGPHVRVWKWNGASLEMVSEFFAEGASDTRGVVGDVHERMLITVTQQGSDAVARSFAMNGKMAWERVVPLGARGATSVTHEDGDVRIATTDNGRIVTLDGETAREVETAHGSVTITSADLDGDGVDELIAADGKTYFHERTEPQYIMVDLSEQRLYAFEYGVLTNTFLISSGRYPYATPQGEHSILAKPLYVNYTWSYGAGNPNNYALGDVKYNLRIYPHIYIHYAYWHNNFGTPQSHGCVNVNLENIKWIYDWADVGTPVTVQA